MTIKRMVVVEKVGMLCNSSSKEFVERERRLCLASSSSCTGGIKQRDERIKVEMASKTSAIREEPPVITSLYNWYQVLNHDRVFHIAETWGLLEDRLVWCLVVSPCIRPSLALSVACLVSKL